MSGTTASCSASKLDPIINGSFDGTWTGWSQSGGNGTRSVSNTTAYAGTYSALINYNMGCTKEKIYQNITVPNVAGTVSLEFWERTYLVSWAGEGGIMINDAWLFYVNYATAGRKNIATAWAKQTLDISAYKGQTIELAIAWYDGNPTYCMVGDHDGWIMIDELKLVY